MKYSKISFSLKLLDVVVCFDLSEDILETDQLRKWYEDWKREAIGRWERNALSCCQVGSSLIKAEVRTPLRLAKSYSLQALLRDVLCPLLHSPAAFCFTHRACPEQTIRLSVNIWHNHLCCSFGWSTFKRGSKAKRARVGKLFLKGVKD